MTAPVAVQLYTVRHLLAKDFAGVVRKIAAMGYLGVEPFSFPGTTPREAARLFESLGLAVPSLHSPLPVGEKKNEVLDTIGALNCKRLVYGFPPEQFKTLDQVKHVCDLSNEADAAARANGLTLVYHNHWWECELVEGRYPYQVMLEQLAPTVLFELDTYWIKTAGLDPAAVIKEMGGRAPLLHIKDGPCVRQQPMTAVGEGILDFPAIIAAAKDTADWLIVELDECATDMMTAVEKSYRYLVSNGLGRGRPV